MSKKVGVLVHPGYNVIHNEKVLKYFSDKIDEYEEVVIFAPLYNKVIVEYFMGYVQDIMLDIYKNDSDDMYIPILNNHFHIYDIFHKEPLWTLYHSMKKVYDKKGTNGKLKNGLKFRFKGETFPAYVKKTVANNIYEFAMQELGKGNESSPYFLQSNLCSFKSINAFLDEQSEKEHVSILKFGSTHFINFMFKNGLADDFTNTYGKDAVYEVFGEYLGRCVDSIASDINEYVPYSDMYVDVKSCVNICDEKEDHVSAAFINILLDDETMDAIAEHVKPVEMRLVI